MKAGKNVKASTYATCYAFNLCAGICGENYKNSGKFYLDNMKAAQGSKNLVNITFSSKPEFYSGFVKGKVLSKKKISIVKFKNTGAAIAAPFSTEMQSSMCR